MTYSFYPPGSLSDHIYLPLKKVEKEIRSEFDNLLRESHEKLEEIAKIEKRLWLRLDNTQQECAKMIADVENKTEEQVKFTKRDLNSNKILYLGLCPPKKRSKPGVS